MDSSISELVLSGVRLMFFGMGIVFLFLALLVWVIGVTSKLIHRYSTEAPSHLTYPPSTLTPSGSPESDAELVSVISAAIHYHQNQQA